MPQAISRSSNGSPRLACPDCASLICCGVSASAPLHPVLVGRAFEWDRHSETPTQSEYGRLNFENSEQMWRQSPFHPLYERGGGSLRRRLGGAQSEFPMLEELRRRGMTDYLAVVTRFGSEGAIGLMDCTYSSWASDRASG